METEVTDVVETPAVVAPAAAAAEPATPWRDTVPVVDGPDDENPAVLEAFYGKDWKKVLGMEDEEQPSEGAPEVAAAVVPAVETQQEPVAPVVETPPAVAPVSDEDAQYAQLGRQWKEAFSTDPKAAMAALLNSPAFTQDDKAALFADVQRAQAQAQAAAQIDPKTYEPASDLERAILPQMDWLRGGEQKVNDAFAIRDRDLQHTFVETQAVAAKLDAICEFLGLELPKHDLAGIFKHFDSSPEGTLQDAVAKVYREAALTAARTEKQKRVPRPDTIRNEAATDRTPKPVSSMAEAWERAGEMLGS